MRAQSGTIFKNKLTSLWVSSTNPSVGEPANICTLTHLDHDRNQFSLRGITWMHALRLFVLDRWRWRRFCQYRGGGHPPSPAPQSVSPALQLLHLWCDGCAVVFPRPPRVLELQSCSKHRHNNQNKRLCYFRFLTGKKTQQKVSWHLCSLSFPLFKESSAAFTLRLLKGMNHTHINKLQWNDTSVIKRTGGNIFCVFALSIRHALLTPLRLLFH